MFCCKCPKKLKGPADQIWPVGMKKDLKTSFPVGKAQAILGQLWRTISTMGLSIVDKKQVAVLVGKAYSFLLRHGNDYIYRSKYIWKEELRWRWHFRRKD